MTVHPMCLDECHGGRNGAEERLVDASLGPRSVRGRGAVTAVSRRRVKLSDALDERVALEQVQRSRVEQGTPSRIHRLRRIQILEEELPDETRVEVFKLLEPHVDSG